MGTAEKLYRELYAKSLTVLGGTHPDTQSACGNLALVHCAQGRHREACPLFHASIGAFRGGLGPRHPATLTLMHGFAQSLFALGRGAEAAALNRDILRGRRLALGPAHWDTVETALALSDVLAAQGCIEGEDLGALGRARREMTGQGVEGDAYPTAPVLFFAKLLYVSTRDERSAAVVDDWVQHLKGREGGVGGGEEWEGDDWWLASIEGKERRKMAFL